MDKEKQMSKKKEQKKHTKGKIEDFRVEVSQTRSDVKSFIEKFKADVDKKKKEYQSYAQRLRKKKS